MPIDEFHDEKRRLACLTDVVERADVRMIQRPDAFRLALKPLARRRISGEAFGKNLDGDVAIEPGIASA